MRSIVHIALVSVIVVSTGLAFEGGNLTAIQMEGAKRLAKEVCV